VYIARCADDSLYCGIALDVAARIAEHDAGKGAKYTAGRGPLSVVLTRRCADKGFALRLEHAIKQLSRHQKASLVSDPKQLATLARRLRSRSSRADRRPRGLIARELPRS
jgi:putative endonuclease